MFGLPPVFVGIVAGFTLSALNMAAGVALAKHSATKPLQHALTIVVAGMLVRLFIVAIMTWICIAVFNLHLAGFTLSLMISFFLMLMIETFFFHAKSKQESKKIIRKRRVKRVEREDIVS